MIHPILIQKIVESVLGQFRFLLFKKDPLLRSRRRICSFISELTKFKLLPQSSSFCCLKMCLRDFTGPNIDMTSFLLEQSGRFLYLQPESHARMQHLVIKFGLTLHVILYYRSQRLVTSVEILSIFRTIEIFSWDMLYFV
jgi:hypothetical protein